MHPVDLWSAIKTKLTNFHNESRGKFRFAIVTIAT